MKFIFFIFVFFILSANLIYPQAGWFGQTSGTSYPLNTIYFTDANTGYTGGGTTGGSLILKTINGGNSWVSSYQSSSPAILCIRFLNSNTGYAVGGYFPNSVIVKTTNAGLNWESQNSTISYALFSVCIVDANTAFCTGDWGHIIKTTNGGSAWFEVNSCTTDYLHYIQFVNANTGFAVGRVGQIIKTTNSGNNWFFLVNNSQWLSSAKFISENTGYAVGTNGTILYSNNSGLTWLAQSSGTTAKLNSIAFIGTSNGFISGDNGIILNTSNAGVNWITQQSGTVNFLSSIYFVNNLVGYTCGGNGTILKTITGGKDLFVPVLITPPNNTFNVPLTPALSWTSDPGVSYYRVQVSSLSNFSVINDSATVTINQRIIPAGKLNNATTYFWRVNATNSLGTGPWSDVWCFSTLITGISQIGSEIPVENKMFNNYPNPFNPNTIIRFKIKDSRFVSLKVYDVTGKVVSTLLNNNLNAGVYEVPFSISQISNNRISSGIYFYTLEAGDFRDTKRMMLIK